MKIYFVYDEKTQEIAGSVHADGYLDSNKIFNLLGANPDDQVMTINGKEHYKNNLTIRSITQISPK